MSLQLPLFQTQLDYPSDLCSPCGFGASHQHTSDWWIGADPLSMLASSIISHSDIFEFVSASPIHLCLVLVQTSCGKISLCGCCDDLDLQQMLVGIHCDGRHPPVLEVVSKSGRTISAVWLLNTLSEDLWDDDDDKIYGSFIPRYYEVCSGVIA